MQLEQTNRICPLCKRAAQDDFNEHAGPTRLCGECRSIVQAVYPGAGARANVAAAHSFQFAAPPEPAAAPSEDYLKAAPAPSDEPYIDLIPPQVEVIDVSIDEELEEDEELAAPPSPAPEAAEAEAFTYTTQTAALNVGGQGKTIAEAASLPEQDAAAFEGADVEQQGSMDGATFQQAPVHRLNTNPLDAAIAAQGDEAAPPEAESHEHAAATDPWDDPLPAWDRSHSEWPMMVPARKGFSFSRLRIPILIVALAALSAAAYLIYTGRQATPSNVATDRSAPAGSEAATAAATVPANQPEPAASNAAAASAEKKEPAAPENTAQEKTEQEKAAQENAQPAPGPAAGDVMSATGTKSLQAASFPNEAAAREFSQPLIRAGLPAYIVAADLGRRGKWFRVRIGRFNSGEEAQKYAATARERARAAGVSLELMVCDFEKDQ